MNVYRLFINLKVNLDDDTSNVIIKSEEVYDFGTVVKMSSFSYPVLFVNGVNMSIFNVENNVLISDTTYSLKTICSLGQ
ncbi:hypothetical protein NQ314_014014 [Rhamnusium bicolor]|uniref:Uncharacterized protein n=1 Tax=Rhamnusium bicolor TaxID=1586634 RepID=A0AAV8X4K0_9CUCU|nr:hypothetical protein NQ314_014014 [Rhamnusium bicolor]